MREALRSPTIRLSIKPQILTGSLILAAAALIAQIFLITEVNAVKEYEMTCEITVDLGDYYEMWCCIWEIDTDTGNKLRLECWEEACIRGNDCSEVEEGTRPPTIDQGEIAPGDKEVLPPPPSGTQENGIVDRSPDQGEILLPTPSERTTQEETGIADRLAEQGEALPTPPDTTQEDNGITKGTIPLQQQLPPVTVEEDELVSPCPEGQVLDEETGLCVLEEPETANKEPEQPEPEERDGSDDNNSNN